MTIQAQNFKAYLNMIYKEKITLRLFSLPIDLGVNSKRADRVLCHVRWTYG